MHRVPGAVCSPPLLASHFSPPCRRSELHVYRGLERGVAGGFVMGHEFTGTVVEAGGAVRTVAVGDRVVAPFTVSWYVVPCPPSEMR